MGLAEELYFAMLEVGYAFRRHKKESTEEVFLEFGESMIYVARKCLPIWRENEHTLPDFARQVLRINIPLRATTGQLPYPLASACWRLISLLEYIAQESEL